MRTRLIIIRVLILFALAVSTAQLADHLSGANAICEFGESCEQVTNSIYGKPFGIPLPFVGVVGFSLLYAFTLVPTQWAATVVRYLGLLAGVVGIGLLTIQFAVLHKVCPLCLMVDSASIALAVVVAIGRPEPSPFSRFRLLGWIAAAPVVLFIPIGWIAAQMPDQAPDQVKAYWEGYENKVTIVEISDFECPFCHQGDDVLREVLKRNQDKVHFVRLPCPKLPPGPPNGLIAARAYYAAGKLGKGEEMSAALYAADSRSKEDCDKMAEKLGLDMEQYKKFFEEPDSERGARATKVWVDKWIANRKLGLPMIWVQDQFLQGIPSAEKLQDAIDKAKANQVEMERR